MSEIEPQWKTLFIMIVINNGYFQIWNELWE